MTATKNSQSDSRTQTDSAADPLATEPATGERFAPGSRQPDKDAAIVAEYIASMTAELAGMAGRARLDMLTYFLNMARLEAEFHIGQKE